MKRHLMLAAAAACAVAATAPSIAAAAAPVECSGTIADQVVGTVTVPYAADCTLRNVVVQGDVLADPDSGALAIERSAVSGDVRSDAGGALTLRLAAVRGILDAVEINGAVTVTGSAVQGDAAIRSADGQVRVGDASARAPRGNVFGGDVAIAGAAAGGTFERNVVAGDAAIRASGPFTVSRNLIGGSLACEGNDPAPTGTGNAAQQLLGQCAAL
jgi:hypothetical protein